MPEQGDARGGGEGGFELGGGEGGGKTGSGGGLSPSTCDCIPNLDDLNRARENQTNDSERMSPQGEKNNDKGVEGSNYSTTNDNYQDSDNFINKDCPIPLACSLLNLQAKLLKHFSNSSGGGVTIDINFSSPIIIDKRYGIYGIGLEGGFVKTKNDKLRFFYTTKITDEAGVSFGLGLNYFNLTNNTPNIIQGTILEGPGFETSASFFFNASYGSDNNVYRGLESFYYIEQLGYGFGFGLPFGYTNWHTFTRIITED